MSRWGKDEKLKIFSFRCFLQFSNKIEILTISLHWTIIKIAQWTEDILSKLVTFTESAIIIGGSKGGA